MLLDRKIDEQCAKLIEDAKAIAHRYKQQTKKFITLKEVKCAYVTFRSMEARNKFIYAYKMT